MLILFLKEFLNNEKGKKLYEGKAKLFASVDKNQVIQHFKDDATAFNNQKKQISKAKEY